MLITLIVVIIAQCKYTAKHQCIHLEYIQFLFDNYILKTNNRYIVAVADEEGEAHEMERGDGSILFIGQILWKGLYRPRARQRILTKYKTYKDLC